MGYRSDIYIAIRKEVFAFDLLVACIPEALKNEKFTEHNGAMYCILEGWKWFSDYPEVRDIEEFFDFIEETPLPELNEWDRYGAIRIGEDDDDCQSWGEPHAFGMFMSRTVNLPFQRR